MQIGQTIYNVPGGGLAAHVHGTRSLREAAESLVGIGTHFPVRSAALIKDVLPEDLQSDRYRKLTLLEAGQEDNRHLPFPETAMDNTATTHFTRFSEDALGRVLPYYGSPHSTAHAKADLMTRIDERNCRIAREFAGGDDRYRAFFVDQGTTGAVGYVVDSLVRNRKAHHGGRNVILVDESAHNAVMMNARKWKELDIQWDIMPVDLESDTVLPETHEAYQRRYRGRVLLTMVTAVSNTTGIVADIVTAAQKAHENGSLILVDAAHLAGHLPMQQARWNVDFLCWSPHKQEAPLGRGVVSYRLGALAGEPARWGGAVIKYVSPEGHEFINEEPGRHQAGTQLVLADITATAAMVMLMRVGMDTILSHEGPLARMLVGGLNAMEGVQVLGPTDMERFLRMGVAAFRVEGLHPLKVSAALSYLFNIASRPGCYCNGIHHGRLTGMTDTDWAKLIRDARQGVRRDLPGSSRLSAALCTTEDDIQRSLLGVRYIREHRDEVDALFTVEKNGSLICAEPEFEGFRGDLLRDMAPWGNDVETWFESQPRDFGGEC